MQLYNYLADAVVGFHVGYVGYIVVGQLLIMVAAMFRWQWARNPWFRFTHLAAIGYVAFEEYMHWRCPLTIWEEQLRELAGGNFNSAETFMGRLFHNLLFLEGFPEVFFTTVHIAAFVLVVQGFLMYPPRMFRSNLFRKRPALDMA